MKNTWQITIGEDFGYTTRALVSIRMPNGNIIKTHCSVGKDSSFQGIQCMGFVMAMHTVRLLNDDKKYAELIKNAWQITVGNSFEPEGSRDVPVSIKASSGETLDTVYRSKEKNSSFEENRYLALAEGLSLIISHTRLVCLVADKPFRFSFIDRNPIDRNPMLSDKPYLLWYKVLNLIDYFNMFIVEYTPTVNSGKSNIKSFSKNDISKMAPSASLSVSQAKAA